MITKAVFFNTWHYGDMHASKEFVRIFANAFAGQGIPVYYATDNNHHAINLPIAAVNLGFCDNRVMTCPPSFLAEDGTVYINIWVGHYLIAHNHNFVNQIPMWKDIALKVIGWSGGTVIPVIPEDPWQIVSKIDVDLLNSVFVPDGRNVLICNNQSISLPSYSTNLHEAIGRLARDFPDYNFIPTLDVGNTENNVIQINRITESANNLPEIGYFARFCDVIVSNSAGPGTYAFNFDTFNDPNKTILSFTVTENNGFWPGIPNVPANTQWHPNFSDEEVYDIVAGILYAKI